MNKEGVGHLEIIIAFVLFIGFLIAALLFFNPLDNSRVLESSLTYAQIEVKENVSVTVERFSIVLNESTLDEGIVSIPLQSGLEGPGVRTETNEGQVIESGYDHGAGMVHLTVPQDRFVVIYFSKAFGTGDISPGPELGDQDFVVSSSEDETMVSEELVLQLRDKYLSDYLSVKEDFNLPNRIDFAFFLVFENSTIEAAINIPSNLEVVSEAERVEVIRSDGSRAFADLMIQVW